MRHTFNRTIAFLAVLGFFSTFLGCTDWKREYEGLEVEHANVEGRLVRSEELNVKSAEEQRRLRQELLRVQRELRQIEQIPADPASSIVWDVDADKLTVTATLPNAILFAAGSATLKTGTIKELDEVYATLVSRYADKDISIVGHTDSDKISKSGWKDNWQLSSERSLSVVRELVKKGWSRSQVLASGAGENRPVGGNSTTTEKAKNRRVEIVVHMF